MQGVEGILSVQECVCVCVCMMVPCVMVPCMMVCVCVCVCVVCVCVCDGVMVMVLLTCPASITAFTFTPSSEPDATVALNMSPDQKGLKIVYCINNICNYKHTHDGPYS